MTRVITMLVILSGLALSPRAFAGSCDGRVTALTVDSAGWVFASISSLSGPSLRVCNLAATAQYPQGAVPPASFLTITPDTCRAWLSLMESSVSRSTQTSPPPNVGIEYNIGNVTTCAQAQSAQGQAAGQVPLPLSVQLAN